MCRRSPRRCSTSWWKKRRGAPAGRNSPAWRTPGFCAALARGIAEFASAGCDAARLARSLPAPLAEAFLAVYRELEGELARRGLALRAGRLELAAQRIEAQGLPGIGAIWLDGFHALPSPELRLIAAMGRHADLTLTLTDGELPDETRERLAAMGFREERASRGRRAPAEILVAAQGIEREAGEIARRILIRRPRGWRSAKWASW